MTNSLFVITRHNLKWIRSILAIFLFLACNAVSLADTWVLFPDTSGPQHVIDSVTDDTNNLYLAITWNNTFWIEKRDPNGNQLWKTVIDRVLIRLAFVDDPANPSLAILMNRTSGDNRPSVQKISCADGSGLWETEVVPTSGTVCYAQDIAVSNTGKIYISGRYKGSIQLGSTTLTSTPPASGIAVWGTDVFVAKLSENGDWLAQISSTRTQANNFAAHGSALTVTDDSVFLMGYGKINDSTIWELNFGGFGIAGNYALTPNEGKYRSYATQFNTDLTPQAMEELFNSDKALSLFLDASQSVAYFAMGVYLTGFPSNPDGGRYLFFGTVENDAELDYWGSIYNYLEPGIGDVTDLDFEPGLTEADRYLWVTVSKKVGDLQFKGTTYHQAGSYFFGMWNNTLKKLTSVRAAGTVSTPRSRMAVGTVDITTGTAARYFAGSPEDASVTIGSESFNSPDRFWWVAKRNNSEWEEHYSLTIDKNLSPCDEGLFLPPLGTLWYAKNQSIDASAPNTLMCGGSEKVLAGYYDESDQFYSTGIVHIPAIYQNMSIEWQYKSPTGDFVGEPLTLPDGVDALTWQLTYIDGDSDNFYQSPVTGDVFPLRPCTATMLWTLGAQSAQDTVVPQWPDDPLHYVVNSPPVDLTESTTHQFIRIMSSENNSTVSNSKYSASEVGYSVLMFSDGLTGNEDSEPVCMQVVHSVHTVELLDTVEEDILIGRKIILTGNKDTARTGWVANEKARFANTPDIYDWNERTGRIIPVNTDDPDDPDDDLIVVIYDNQSANTFGIAWPYLTRRYHADWPRSPSVLYVTSELGSEESGYIFDPEITREHQIYAQNDPNVPGFNPNDEHALILPSKQDPLRVAAYAMRYDAARKASQPYVLIKYFKTTSGAYHFKIFKVSWAPGNFTFNAVAGDSVPLPYPLQYMDSCPAILDRVLDPALNPYFADHNGRIWAKCAGTMWLQLQYPLTEAFFLDLNDDLQQDLEPVGTCMSWGIDVDQNPDPTKYIVTWGDAPEIKTGRTFLEATTVIGGSVPNIVNQAAVRIVYDGLQTTNPSYTPAGYQQTAAQILDPFTERRIAMSSFPPISVKRDGDRLIPTDLPYSLRVRFSYDSSRSELCFKGFLLDQGAGEKLLLPNILNDDEVETIQALSNQTGFADKILELQKKTRNPGELDGDHDASPDEALLVGWQDGGTHLVPFAALGVSAALSTGASQVTDSTYITLVMNDDDSLGSLPVSMTVLKVVPELYSGEIKVFYPTDNVFEEKLVLRHSCDFLGQPEPYEFEWRFTSAEIVPGPATPGAGAQNFAQVKTLDPDGLVEIVLRGASEVTLRDNHFWVRYRRSGQDPWSQWAGASGGGQPQLAPGWVKRVILGINPFESRVRDFHDSPLNTYASMLTMAGERYEGDIAFNPAAENLNDVGLIETYETVLRRTMKLSFDNFDPGDPFLYYDTDGTLPDYMENMSVSNCVLFSASRIADLYKLLGDEAYSDALDPTIGFTTSDGVAGDAAGAMFSFENQVPSLIDEELVLLRGRDDYDTSVRVKPLYNRFFWNYTSGRGELAYGQCYGVHDMNTDGVIDELDAKILYPQGHGDAWGYYLTGIMNYYRLLKNPIFVWEPRIEQVLVGGQPVAVDFTDERKFAALAAARAKLGEDIVNTTYRQYFEEDSSKQWQGYKDPDEERAWGVSGWAHRAGQSALLDWAMANALLPEEDTVHTGIQKIDRGTVPEIGEISQHLIAIQSKMDEADHLLNPLGLAKGVVPFDINPSLVLHPTAGKTHFEQIYDRAVEALMNCMVTFNNANEQTHRLRENQDSVSDFASNVEDQERDFINRLIEAFGYPYDDDIGPGQIYPAGYEGPDLYHYNYVDAGELTGENTVDTEEITAFYKPMDGVGFYPGDDSGDSSKEITYHISSDGADFVPQDFSGSRRAPGEIQLALSEFLLNRAGYEQALINYENHTLSVEALQKELMVKYAINAAEIVVRNDLLHKVKSLNDQILSARALALGSRAASAFALNLAESLAEAFPKSIGLATDATAPARSFAKLTGTLAAGAFDLAAIGFEEWELGSSLAKEEAEMRSSIQIEVLSQQFEVLQRTLEIEGLLREEPLLRLELYRQLEIVKQSYGRYNQIVARAFRLLDDYIVFRKRAMVDTQEYRYRDMTFRTLRNDALQKYRAQFDLAARYTYLAAEAYDYETNLLGTENGAGLHFLTTIVKKRCPGLIVDGVPMAGSHGLADSLASMKLNFDVLKGQLGFNNPQTETNRFSLRQEFVRVFEKDRRWRRVLQRAYVPDLWAIPEFRRYCRPFAPEYEGAQPGLVFEFSTDVTFGNNYFGKPLMGGDSAYDPSHFATKIRSVGVWFSNYNATGLSQTPRVYLIPVGSDKLRSPSANNFNIRDWAVVDQRLPEPFPLRQDQLQDPDFIPVNEGLNGDLFEIRQHSSLRAYHDYGDFDPDEVSSDSRLIGRSVWNTRWLLIIPGGTLLNDANQGISTLINGVSGNGDGISDIKLFFQTYSYSGNKNTGKTGCIQDSQEVNHD